MTNPQPASGEGQGPPAPPEAPVTAPGSDDYPRWFPWLSIAVYAAGLWLLVVMAFDWRALRLSAVVIYIATGLPWLLVMVLKQHRDPQASTHTGDSA